MASVEQSSTESSSTPKKQTVAIVDNIAKQLPFLLRDPILRVTGIKGLVKLYESIPRGLSCFEFADTLLERFNVETLLLGESLHTIPAKGPVIFVSNHPFGAIEGLFMASVFGKVRPDLQVLANYFLHGIPELAPLFIGVDPFENPGVQAKNIAGIRAARKHLDNGGALSIFPSGTVSHLHPRQREIVDPAWRTTVGRLAHVSSATVVPLFFHGRNSLSFNILGLIHPMLRTFMLAKEMLKKQHKTISISIGRCIPPRTLDHLPSDQARTTLLRMRCYSLKPPKKHGLFSRPKKKSIPIEAYEPIAEPQDSAKILAEVLAVPEKNHLLSQDVFDVFVTDYEHSPHIVKEIGRLREITFRQVGEGSGFAEDLDQYDKDYWHMILWHRENKEIAGAYRIGDVAPLLNKYGEAGLYSSTLFHFKPEFFNLVGNALELGRAFVLPSYQREYSPLLLMWQGISTFAYKKGDTRMLFGPVSVSLEYTPFSLNAIMQYIMKHHGCAKTASLVKGKTAPRFRQPGGKLSIAPDELNWNKLNTIVEDLEGEGRTIPILFKHYLKLGGRIGTFHVDKEFGSLDAFLIVDLRTSNHKMMQRFMGKEEFTRFLAETPDTPSIHSLPVE